MTLYEQIIEAQQEQLAKPARAVVNSECSFVCEKLRNRGYDKAAALYWSFTCGTAKIKNVKVNRLHKQLRDIDSQSTMPEWGTYGT